MEVEDIRLDFKCPNCLRRFQRELSPGQVDLSVENETCPVHISHTIIGMAFTCPNCNEKLAVEIISDQVKGDEDDYVL